MDSLTGFGFVQRIVIYLDGNEISTRNHYPLDKYNYALDNSKGIYPLDSATHYIYKSLSTGEINRFSKNLYLSMDSGFSTE